MIVLRWPTSGRLLLRIADQLPQKSICGGSRLVSSHVQDLLRQCINTAGLYRSVDRNVSAVLVQYDVSAERIFHLVLVGGKAHQHGSIAVSSAHSLINAVLTGAIGRNSVGRSADDLFPALDHGIGGTVGIVHDQRSVFLQIIAVYTTVQ